MWLVSLALAAVVPPRLPAGPCDLVDQAAAVALLGGPVTAGPSAGPEPDDETNGIMSYCTYQRGGAALVTSMVVFKTAGDAAKAMSDEVVQSRMDSPAKLVPEEGLGDKAVWAYNDEGSEFVVLKGKTAVGVALGGDLGKKPASFHDALRATTAKAVAKL